MTKVKIRLLGGMQVCSPDGASPTRKARAVCAYLALQNGQPQSRGRIGALFWEDSPEEQARTSLRQCLTILRKCLGAAVQAEADAVALDPAAVEVDATLFEALVGRGDRVALEEAVELYRGDLLDGFALREEAFEAWLRPERERYRGLMATALLGLVDDCEALADTNSVIRFATRMLEIDPLNEQAHRRLMRAYAAHGRHDAALRQFETCRDVLARELGVQPQLETLALRAQLRTERRSGADPRGEPAPPKDYGSGITALGIDFALPAKPSIIVTPITDLSDGGALRHFAGGIQIDLQSALVKISGLFVIAAGSAGTYAERVVAPEQVAGEMGVRYVLEGIVRGNRDRIRVTVKLTDGTSGRIVWSERYDGALDATLVIQDQIIEKIVTALDVQLVSGEQGRVWRKTLRDPKALALYYRGLELLEQFDRSNVAAARQVFERVAEIAPDVTLGPTLVAFCHYWDATMGWAPDATSALDAAAAWSERAAAMEDADGQAHAILAHVKLRRGLHREAIVIIEEAIRIRPLCANTNALYANILLYCGRPREAAERVASAIRYAPVYATWWLEILASACRDAGQPEPAIAVAHELVRKNADGVGALVILASALVAGGRLAEARQTAQRILQVAPDFTRTGYARQHPYAEQGAVARLLELLRGAGLPY